MNGETKQKAIEMLAAGCTGSETAKATGTSNATVSRLRNRKDIKPLLDAGFRELVGRCIDNAVNNTAMLIGSANKHLTKLSQKETVDPKAFEEAKVLFDLAGKREKRVFDAAGFGNPQTQSVHLTNITNNLNQSLDPAVIDLLKAAMPGTNGHEDVIDVDLELDNEEPANSN